jgi:hypothetical protein
MPPPYASDNLAERPSLDRRQKFDAIVEAIDQLTYMVKGQQSRAPDGDDVNVLLPMIDTIRQRFADATDTNTIGHDAGLGIATAQVLDTLVRDGRTYELIAACLDHLRRIVVTERAAAAERPENDRGSSWALDRPTAIGPNRRTRPSAGTRLWSGLSNTWLAAVACLIGLAVLGSIFAIVTSFQIASRMETEESAGEKRIRTLVESSRQTLDAQSRTPRDDGSLQNAVQQALTSAKDNRDYLDQSLRIIRSEIEARESTRKQQDASNRADAEMDARDSRALMTDALHVISDTLPQALAQIGTLKQRLDRLSPTPNRPNVQTSDAKTPAWPASDAQPPTTDTAAAIPSLPITPVATRCKIKLEELKLTPSQRKEIQHKLTGLGFNTQNDDGHFGSKSRSAIKAWQVRQKVPPTGKLSPDQLKQLLGNQPACT